MNKIILCGRLTKDPEVRVSGDKTIGKFNLAVERRFKSENQPTADFFNCTTFGKQAEFVEKYLKKGTKVIVSGRLQNDNYTGKDGNKVYSVQIMVEELEFAESKKSEDSQQSSGSDFMNIPDSLVDELPFQ